MQRLHDAHRISFASDNLAGVHPEVLAALSTANSGHVAGYGEDVYTGAFDDLVVDLFGEGALAYPVLNGTGANVLALAAATPRWGGVLTPVSSHLVTDEAGAPERSAGLKLIQSPAPDGKLTVEDVRGAAADLGNQHHAQPTTVSIANVTELGTLYSPEEIAALSTEAHAHGMLLHLDGSRLANAAAALSVDLGALTTEVGVDILSLGATKNGAMLAEAVVVLPGAPAGLAHAVHMSRKAQTQLVSKTRFVSAQLLAMFGTDLWRRNADRANTATARLAEGLRASGLTPVHTVGANLIFTPLPQDRIEQLRAEFDFHGDGTQASPARLVCAFDTPDDAVGRFVAALTGAAGAA
ncbi:MAG: threonine aldolase family protein [Galactobacter sp.]|uniref:threonine aldolase family protein n=1 Tax=Galactobacter sp. TaxID=2676125 RepID=UPI0025B7BB96|nr:beta-eliminating lyase-related protein [Galactobacter sp.]